MLTVHVDNQKYDIHIEKGALEQAGSWLQTIWRPQKVAVITDTNVAPLYAEKIMFQLRQANFEPVLSIVPAGETSKSLEQAAELYDFLADNDFTRSDGILALGGGMVGDLAAFVASTFMRGIHFVQIPTTLLAQVDSSIGGKTAVNTNKAKNLVGTFSQPAGVLIDPEVLKTLPVRRLREGIAEIIKSAAIADATLWKQLNELKDEKDLLEHAVPIITATLEIKRKVVEEDVFDQGNRLILNFGHTIGHALEKLSDYTLPHGYGVAIGMAMITRGYYRMGKTLERILQKFHLPITYDLSHPDELFHAITHDKKARGSQLNIILLEKIGQAKIVPVPTETFKDYLGGL